MQGSAADVQADALAWLEQELEIKRLSTNGQLQLQHKEILLRFETWLGAPPDLRVGCCEMSPSLLPRAELCDSEEARPTTAKSTPMGGRVPKQHVDSDKLLSITSAAASTAEASNGVNGEPQKSKLMHVGEVGVVSPPESHQLIRGLSSVSTHSTHVDPDYLTFHGRFRQVLFHPAFELVFLLLIVVNTVAMAIEVQYIGIDIGYRIGHPSSVAEASVAMPGMAEILRVSGVAFGVLFTAEILFKVVASPSSFCFCAWNIFDSVVVVFWWFDFLGDVDLPIEPMALRLCRLARLLRVVRLARKARFLDSLQLLISAIRAAGSTFVWSMSILALIIIVHALCLNALLRDFMEDEDFHIEDRNKVYEYFGTFSRSVLTMFEVTLGNWIPACRMLAENVNEWYALAFIMYKCLVGFAVMKVITGVFLHETFAVAGSDDAIMISHQEKASAMHKKKMQALLAKAKVDDTGDGHLTWEEFKMVAEDSRTRMWLAAMGLDVRDAETLFSLLDHGGDHTLSFDEIATGIATLKGPARALDMAVLMRDFGHLTKAVSSFAATTSSSLRSLERLEPEIEEQLHSVTHHAPNFSATPKSGTSFFE